MSDFVPITDLSPINGFYVEEVPHIDEEGSQSLIVVYVRFQMEGDWIRFCMSEATAQMLAEDLRAVAGFDMTKHQN